jgi:hypothetical protein
MSAPDSNDNASPATLGTLTVTRDTPDDVQDRWVRLWVDGTFWEILRYGQSLSIDLPAGRHHLKAHNTLSGDTLDFDVRPGAHVRVRCHNAIGSGGFLSILMIGVAAIRVRLELVGPM